jgi:hypothetical protein
MSVFRINKTQNYTVMSNHHFKEKKMSLKAKGLLSLMLSLPDDWDYSISGLATLSKDGKDSIMSALAELEKFGYLTRTRLTNEKGQFAGVEYNIFEIPQPKNPISEKPNEENENSENSNAEKPAQLNTNLTNHLFNELYNQLSTNDGELLELYQQYIQVRENMKAPLNETSLEKLISRAKKLSNNNIRIEKVLLENAIINNWKNVYPPRESELARLNGDLQNELRDMFGLEDDL